MKHFASSFMISYLKRKINTGESGDHQDVVTRCSKLEYMRTNERKAVWKERLKVELMIVQKMKSLFS